MALVVNTNLKALEELSSGLEINSDEDEPAGYGIANSFKAIMASIKGASQNTNQVQPMLQRVDGAYSQINDILVQQGKFNIGAFQNQLQYAVNNVTTSIQNYTSSESTIEDVDTAFEVSNLTKNQILQHSAMAMLAQANAQPLQMLKLH